MKLGSGLSFSWKRALGVTKAKWQVSKKTCIPLSRGGRRMKLGKWLGDEVGALPIYSGVLLENA